MKTLALNALRQRRSALHFPVPLLYVTLFVSSFLSSAVAADGSINLVSRVYPTIGPSESAMGSSFLVTATPDGRFVLFNSSAPNLATNTPLRRPGFPATSDVFLRDRLSGVTRCVGLLTGSNQGAYGMAISTNGTSVLYLLSALDLSKPDAIVLRDLSTGSLIPISTPAAGLEPNGPALDAVMTPDARFVAFVSSATNLVAADTNGIDDVFLRDVATGETTLVSLGAMSTGNAQVRSGASYEPLISADGTKVAFASTATNLLSNVPVVAGASQYSDIYLRDFSAGTTAWVSKNARAFLMSELGLTNGFSYGHVMSADGRYVAYMASSGSGQTALVLRYDAWTATTRLVYTNALSGVAPYFAGSSLSMTPNGRYLAFAANVGAPGYASSTLVWDSDDGSLTVASANLANQVSTNDVSIAPVLSEDGTRVAFLSDSTTLVTNAVSEGTHLYVRDLNAGRTVLVDADGTGSGAPGLIEDAPVIDQSGSTVFFTGLQNILLGDRNEDYDVMARRVNLGSTELITVRAPQLPSETPNGRSDFGPSPMNNDGSIVAFHSLATDLLPSANSFEGDVFVQNMATGGVQVVRAGTNNDEPASQGAMSSDGRWVAYVTLAPFPAMGDTNFWTDIYLRDLITGTTTLVSAATNGASSTADSYSPLVSFEGRFVLFRSRAKNISQPRVHISSTENVFLRDIQGNKTYPITTAGPPVSVSFTPDGSRAGVLVPLNPGQPTANISFRIWDTSQQQFVQIVTNLGPYCAALSPDGNVYAGWNTNGSVLVLGRVGAGTNQPIYTNVTTVRQPLAIALSANGDRVAFTANDSRGVKQVYLHQTATGETRLVSRDFASSGAAGGADSDEPVLSPDGRFLAFRSEAENLVPNDQNAQPDLFLHEIDSGNLRLVTRSIFGDFTADGRSGSPVFSRDSTRLLFLSWADDLVPFDYNNWSDIFQVELPAAPRIEPFSLTLLPHSSGGWELTWPAQPGVGYTVRVAADLSNPNWTAAPGPVKVVGNRAHLIDSSANAGARFYQVIAK